MEGERRENRRRKKNWSAGIDSKITFQDCSCKRRAFVSISFDLEHKEC